jgi:hypothetical protein
MSRRAAQLTDLDDLKLPAVQLAAPFGITENEPTQTGQAGANN